MPVIIDHKTTVTTADVTSFTAELPDNYAIGDYLVLSIFKKDDLGGTLTTPSGWTPVTLGGEGDFHSVGGRIQVFYLVATSTSHANPTTTTTDLDPFVGMVTALRGVDVTTPFEFASTNFQATAHDTTTLTGVDSLILFYTGYQLSDETRLAEIDSNMRLASEHAQNTMRWTLDYTAQQDAGAMTSTSVNQTTQLLTLVIKNNGNNKQPYVSDFNSTPINRFYDNVRIDDEVDAAAIEEDPVTIAPTITAINGESTIYCGGASVASGGSWLKSRDDVTTFSTNTNSALNITRNYFNGTALDFSSGIFAIHIGKAGGFNIDMLGVFDISKDGFIIVLQDSLGAWSAYNVSPVGFGVRGATYNLFQIEPSVATVLSASGVIDLTDVVRISYAFHKGSTTANYPLFCNATRYDDYVILAGGGSSYPVGAKETFTAMDGMADFIEYLQGTSQLLLSRGIQLGSATKNIYADYQYDAIEFIPNTEELTQIADGSLGIKILTNSSSTVKMNNCTINGVNQYDFNILSGAAGAIDLQNAQILNANDIALRSPVVAGGAVFASFNSFTPNNADLSDGVTFDGALGTEAVIVTSEAGLSNLANSTFKNNAVGVKITGDQAGTWTDPNLTVSGNTFDIEYTGATDFSINVAIGTYTINNSGAGTLTLSAVTSLTVSNANLVDGSRVQLYNVTAAVEIENVVLTGAGYTSPTLVAGTDYTIGDTLALYATQYIGGGTPSAKENYVEQAVAGSTDIVFVGAQVTWDEFADLAVDPDTVTECSTDYVNVQVDVTDTDDSTTKVRIMAFLVKAQTEADGIRNWFGALSLIDGSNGIWDQSVAAINVSNEKAASTLAIIDEATFRNADGSSMIVGSTYSIVWESGLVRQLETGVSGLTAGESAKLDVIGDVDAKVDIVDTNVDAVKVKTDDLTFTKANELDTNIQSLNGTALNGTGAEGDLWRG